MSMADFLPAYEAMIRNEGGYRLHDVQGDRGGRTYAGIARSRWPRWAGWADIDAGRVPASDLVRQFYREQFWEPVHGDAIAHQGIARTLFDYAVNSGVAVAVKLAQIVVGATPDGRFGPKTLAALNDADPELFRVSYALAKVARYAAIVTKDRGQGKFLLGWINRTLKEAV